MSVQRSAHPLLCYSLERIVAHRVELHAFRQEQSVLHPQIDTVPDCTERRLSVVQVSQENLENLKIRTLLPIQNPQTKRRLVVLALKHRRICEAPKEVTTCHKHKQIDLYCHRGILFVHEGKIFEGV